MIKKEVNAMIYTILENIGAQWELFVRLLLACTCGAIIGLERSHRRKDAGIKTHIILAMGLNSPTCH